MVNLEIKELQFLNGIKALAMIAEFSPIPTPPDIVSVMRWIISMKTDNESASKIADILAILFGVTREWLAIHLEPSDIMPLLGIVSTKNPTFNEALSFVVKLKDVAHAE